MKNLRMRQLQALGLIFILISLFQNCGSSGFQVAESYGTLDSASSVQEDPSDEPSQPTPPVSELPDPGTPPPAGGGTLPQKESSWHSYVGALQDKSLVDSKLAGFFPAANQIYQTVYVAAPGNGSGGAGTKANPYLNLKSTLENATAGQRIYLLPGNYSLSTNIGLSRSGVMGKPMILSTDPEQFDPATGKIAVIDFNKNEGLTIYGNYWLIENLEIKNTQPRMLHINAQWVVVRNTNLHDNNPTGNNNNAIIMIDHPMRWEGFQNNPNMTQADLSVLTTERRYNFFMNNHIHHGKASDNGLNQGCTYSVTAQSYYMAHLQGILGINSNVTLADVQNKYYAPTTGEIYYYNNLVHDCHYGIATKNAGDGPIYILSNTIYNSSEGIKTTLSGGLLRNNIIYNGQEGMSAGIVVGWPGSTSGPLYDLLNAVNTTIESNLIVGASTPISMSAASWNLQVKNNMMLGFNDAFSVGWQTAFWFNGGGWPGVPSLGMKYDVNESNPYWNSFPQYMKDKKGSFKAVSFSGNAYTKIPLVRSSIEAEAGSQGLINVSGTRLDTTSTVDASLGSYYSTTGTRPYTLSDSFKSSHPNLGPQR